MKEDDIDNRIVRVIESVASKKADMRQWESDKIALQQHRKITVKRWLTYSLTAAASVIIICGIGIGVLMMRIGGNDYDDSSAPMYRGGTSDFDEIEAMIISEKYQEALQAIEVTMEDTIIDPTYSIERQEYLRSIYKSQEYELIWLKIQVLVKLEKEKEAMNLLEDYVKKDGEHQAEAKELLEKLE